MTAITIGDLIVDPAASTAALPRGVRPLSAFQLTLLLALADAAGTPVPRSALIARMWPAGGGRDNDLIHAISRLRDLVEDDPAHPRRLVTVKGTGYALLPLKARKGGRQMSPPPNKWPGPLRVTSSELLELQPVAVRALEARPAAMQVLFQGTPLPLLPVRQFTFLYALLRSPARVHTADELAQSFITTPVAGARTVPKVMQSLQRSLAKAGARDYVRAVPGRGYVVDPVAVCARRSREGT